VKPEGIFDKAGPSGPFYYHKIISTIFRYNVTVRSTFEGRELIEHRPISVTLTNVYVGSILWTDIGYIEEKFDGAPVVEVKVKAILRINGPHRSGVLVGRETPPQPRSQRERTSTQAGACNRQNYWIPPQMPNRFAVSDAIEVVSNNSISGQQTAAWRAIERALTLGVSVALRACGKRPHVCNGVLAKAKPIRDSVNPDTVGDLLSRQFSLQHSGFSGSLRQERTPLPLSPCIFLEYLEASEGEHHEPVDATDHGRIDPKLMEPTAGC
jgi:hypothetical protein